MNLLNPGEESGLGLRIKQRKKEPVILHGLDARRVASKVFPLLNHEGARSNTVKEAVSMLGEAGGPEAFLQETWGKARPRPGSSIRWAMSRDMRGGEIPFLPPLSRIAFEMALHEERERRAMEGELHELQAAWRAAEELAEISDNLLIPEAVGEKVASMKNTGG